MIPEKPDVCVVGGAGHVGLPLSLVLASRSLRVHIVDINQESLDSIRRGVVPFTEDGAAPLLTAALQDGRLTLGSNPESVRDADTVIIIIGTSVDELSGVQDLIRHCVDSLLPFVSDRQLIVLRSTVYPGVTEWLRRYVESAGKSPDIAYCPDRTVQGMAIKEIQCLPQIVSGVTPAAEERAATLFRRIGVEIVRLSPMEAEFAKLYTNAYRYITFAVSNQFYTMATRAGLDYARIQEAAARNYPRMSAAPSAGLTGGPCLLKDTMQLAAFCRDQFSIGVAAMKVNEGVPHFVVERLELERDLRPLTIGLLGMAFKSNSDDTRASLGYRLKELLESRCKAVVTTDPHVVRDPALRPVEEVVSRSDLLILCVPHDAYRTLDRRGKSVIDIWNFYGQGSLV